MPKENFTVDAYTMLGAKIRIQVAAQDNVTDFDHLANKLIIQYQKPGAANIIP